MKKSISIFGVALAVSMCTAAPLAAQTLISWANPVNARPASGALTKTAGCDGCFDAGGHGATAIVGDGYVEFVPAAGHRIVAGLSAGVTPALSTTIDFAFGIWPNGAWDIRERGVYRTEGAFTAGDRLAVCVESGAVVYRLNGVVVYRSATPPAGSLTPDVLLASAGASVSGTASGLGAIGALQTALVSAGPYRAVIDRQAYARPPVPPLGPAGSVFNDPVFLSRITRVTDNITRPGAVDRSFRTPSSPHQNAWSANGSYFYVVSGDGSVIPFGFDPSTGAAHRLQPSATGDGGLVLHFYVEPQFSYVTDSLIYGGLTGVAGATLHTIDQYDFSTGAYSRLLDLETIVPGLAGTYIGGLASSGGPTERIMAFFGGKAQDYHHYVVVFDKANPQNRLVLDTTGNTLNGAPTSMPLSFSLHHVAIDRSGRYVMLYPTWADLASPRNAAQSYLWDTATGGFTEMGAGARPYGHDAFGYGTSVNQDCCVSTSWDAAQWQMRQLATPLVTHDVIKTVLPNKEIYLGEHSTWNNARADRMMPFVSGLYRSPASTTEWRAWDDEIVAVQTDTPSNQDATVWRFAHHRSDVRSDLDATKISFWYEPRPNISRDGGWVLFTSNWEKTLGTDPTGEPGTGARQDVFLVALAAGVVPVKISSPRNIPPATAGQPYAYQVLASNVQGTPIWNLQGGAPPPGITLGPTGLVAGTCSAPGTYYFNARVRDANSDDTLTLTLVVR